MIKLVGILSIINRYLMLSKKIIKKRLNALSLRVHVVFVYHCTGAFVHIGRKFVPEAGTMLHTIALNTLIY